MKESIFLLLRPIFAVLTGVLIISLIRELPFIPSWDWVVILMIFSVSALLSFLVARDFLRNRFGCSSVTKWIFFMVGLASIYTLFMLALISFWALIDPPLVGEYLIEKIEHNKTNERIYVYETSGVPDGFISTRIATKIRWLPFEETIFKIKEPFLDYQERGNSVLLWFDVIGEGQEEYIYMNRRIELVKEST